MKKKHKALWMYRWDQGRKTSLDLEKEQKLLQPRLSASSIPFLPLLKTVSSQCSFQHPVSAWKHVRGQTLTASTSLGHVQLQQQCLHAALRHTNRPGQAKAPAQLPPYLLYTAGKRPILIFQRERSIAEPHSLAAHCVLFYGHHLAIPRTWFSKRNPTLVTAILFTVSIYILFFFFNTTSWTIY